MSSSERKTKIFRRLLAAAVSAGLLAIGVFTHAEAEEESDALERVRERGALTVAVYEDFPPFSFRGEKGQFRAGGHAPGEQERQSGGVTG